MKKFICLLVVFCLAAPAMAALTFGTADNGDGQLKISYTTSDGDLPRGIALKVTLSGSATVDPCAVVSSLSAFNCYIDYAADDPCTYNVGDGHPLADASGAGSLLSASSVFSICMGVLDPCGTQAAGPASGDLIILQLTQGTGNPTATIEADELRGPDSGVVGSVITSNLSGGQSIQQEVLFGCFPSDHDDYAAWLVAGEALGLGEGQGPECWCSEVQCYGDADGIQQVTKSGTWWVNIEDLNIVLNGYQLADGVAGTLYPFSTWVCGDLNHIVEVTKAGTWRINIDDLNIVLWNYENDSRSDTPPYADWSTPSRADCLSRGY